MDFNGFLNADYIDRQYRIWKKDRSAVPKDWQFFFQGFELAGAESRPDGAGRNLARLQSRAEALIYRYRDIGHLLSCLDPLTACPADHPLLTPSAVGLSEKDLDETVYVDEPFHSGKASIREIVRNLRETYCRSVGIEYMHLQDPSERRWLQDRMEPDRNRPLFDKSSKIRILEKLFQANLFEQFLHKKYVGQTRFSLEGAETVIAMLDSLVQEADKQGVREIILGMAHRGRLNVQANILKRPYEEIYNEFEYCYDPDALVGSGDVKYHGGYFNDLKTESGRPIRIFLVNNPSHLEVVNPVVLGFSRARQDLSGKEAAGIVLPLLLHGDAAFAGQGVTAESLNLSQLKGYRAGGTVHIVINNQIGYTTVPEDARSTRYATDVAKMLMVPIFHVHGEDPEAALHATRLAFEYRMAFQKDVVIDVVCYRRYGHNEGDEPYFTQPEMYRRIRDRKPISRMYADRLIETKAIDSRAVEPIEGKIIESMEHAYESVHGKACSFPALRFYENWEGLYGPFTRDPVDTRVDGKRLKAFALKLNTVPESFTLYPKLARILQARKESIEKGSGIDWGNAEALSFASLLTEGVPIRLSGQDVSRGTFSQRHAVIVDAENGNRYIPLNALAENQARLSVYDSMLSEAGVLGFEYGYSLAQPRGLVLWEAQYGDFVNNAQPIIDLFIVSGEAKWQRPSGLTLLLPHGSEGLGPEHSSARPERFLQLCADDNIQICNPTTPAQYFHLLRRQAGSGFRKPLVVLTPKILLRHPMAVSELGDFTSGGFKEILEDAAGPKSMPQRILLCSGKIYYELLQRRNQLKAEDIAIVRIEQLYPIAWPQLDLLKDRYRDSVQWVWVQEEPENMGAWRFIKPILEGIGGRPVEYIGRAAASSPAAGYPHISKKQQAEIIEKAVTR
jgi:2-oxoglutarate dehydrogenase E1 component